MSKRASTLSMIVASAALAAVAACGQADSVQADDAPPPAGPAAGPSAAAVPSQPADEAVDADEAPGFLVGTDLPRHPTSAWSAGEVTRGLPEFDPFCLEGVLPADSSWHREFGTEFDTHAGQVAVRAASEDAAIELARELAEAVASCAADWLRENSGGTASWQDYGPAGERAHVVGVHTALPDSGTSVHLFGVGRDGTLVTVVDWAQMGNLDDAPVPAFTRTITTAVNKL